MCSYFPKGLCLFLLPWILREPTQVSGLKELHHPRMLLIHEKKKPTLTYANKWGRDAEYTTNTFFFLNLLHGFLFKWQFRPDSTYVTPDRRHTASAGCLCHGALVAAPYLSPTGPMFRQFVLENIFIPFLTKKKQPSNLTSQTQIRVKTSFGVHWHFASVRRLKSKSHSRCIGCWLVLNHGVC